MRPFTLDKRLTVLQGTQAVGKTHAMSKAVVERELPFVLVTHRIALITNLAQRFNALSPKYPCRHYKNSGSEQSVATTLHSLHNQDLPTEYVIVIDEIAQLLRELGGDLLKENYHSVMTSFKKALRGAKHVVVADANVTEDEIAYLQAELGVSNEDIEWHHNTHTPDLGTACRLNDREEMVVLALQQAALGRKLFVFVDRRAYVGGLDALMKRFEARGLNVLTIHGDSQADLKQTFAANPDEYLEKHKVDVLLVNSALMTGVDISGSYIDDVFLFAIPTNCHTPEEYVQALRRVRNPNGNTFYYIGQPNKDLYKRPETANELLERYDQKERLFKQRCAELGGSKNPLNDDEYQLYRAEVTAQDNRQIHRLPIAFPNVLTRVGYSLRDYDGALEGLSEDNVALAAQDIDELRRRLVLRHMLQNPLTEDGFLFIAEPTREQFDAQRYHWSNGRSSEDAGYIVKESRPDKFVRATEYLDLLVRDSDEILGDHRLKLASRANPFTAHNFTDVVSQAKCLRQVVEAADFPLTSLEPYAAINAPQLFQAINDWRHVWTDREGGIGLGLPKTVAKAPAAFRSLMTNRFYFDVSSKQRRQGKERVRDYFTTEESVRAMRNVCLRRLSWFRNAEPLELSIFLP